LLGFSTEEEEKVMAEIKALFDVRGMERREVEDANLHEIVGFIITCFSFPLSGTLGFDISKPETNGSLYRDGSDMDGPVKG